MKLDFDFSKTFSRIKAIDLAEIKEGLSSFSPFRIMSKKCLGIDIGTSSVRVVELSRLGERKKLENYGEIKAGAFYKESFRTFDKNTLLLSNQNIAKSIKAILEEAKITTGRAIFSIPDFSSFFTNFELPTMTEEELPQAIEYEAKRHVPLPLGEVTLDWQILDNNNPKNPQKERTFKVLLVAVPNEIIEQYKQIAKMAGLELFALEAEVFGLLRSLVKEEQEPVALVDIGAQTSTCSIVDRGVLKNSHSFDLSGNELTDVVAKSLSVDYQTAEKLKGKYGLLPEGAIGLEKEKQTRDILLPLIDAILREIENIYQDFYRIEKREVKKIILAGASVLLPGLRDYCQDYFKKEVEVANPFSDIFYPPILENKLKKMGPIYAIAIGMALRGLE